MQQLQNPLRVERQWLWSYFAGQRGSRLIPEPRKHRVRKRVNTQSVSNAQPNGEWPAKLPRIPFHINIDRVPEA